ncbi:MAG TPA: nucleotide exchange factor GrpE [Acidimicrobiales bacterium]|jgi:molecular chaperone GrpE
MTDAPRRSDAADAPTPPAGGDGAAPPGPDEAADSTEAAADGTDAGAEAAAEAAEATAATDAPGADGAAPDAPDAAAAEPVAEGDDAQAELQAAADALEVDLELLLAEREQYLDAYRRAQADFENYRKQAQKRQDDAVLASLGRFVEGLLPVLDSCDAALAHGASEVEPVLTALYGALSKEGLERLDPKGAAFDPAEAEAVVHEPGEGGDQVVAEVLRPGYRWRGRVIRPAMVKVTD